MKTSKKKGGVGKRIECLLIGKRSERNKLKKKKLTFNFLYDMTQHFILVVL